MSSSTRSRSKAGALLVSLAVVLSLLAAACSSGDSSADTADTVPSGAGGGAAAEATADVVRLGYFGNVTHAPGIIALEEGFFEDALGDTTLETSIFNAGTEAITAIFSDALDISFIGPNPAINAFAQSNGEAIRIVSGTTSGGALFVVKPEINTVEDLEGKVIATPQLGNTQDVALRAWLKEQGYETDTAGGGDVSVRPQQNADTLSTFQAGGADGAWLPEPWATRLIQEAGAEVFLDEADLWPDGQFVTTHVIVSTRFLEQHPGTVKAILEGLLSALDFIEASPEQAKTVTNAGIERATTRPLPQQVIDSAWENLEFTADPIAQSLVKSAEDAVEAELLEPVELSGIYDLTILNQLLAAANRPAISPAGL